MFVDTFIQRPILASVCSLVIILAGAVAIPTMPVAQYPDLAPPQVSVIAVYNGANAQAVETAVTTPLEQALNGVEGMLYMTSSSTNSGVSQITVTFDVTRNSDIAAVDVQNRVSQTLGRLPPEVRALGVNVQKNSTGFVLGAGVYAENSAYDSLFLSNYIDVYVKDALQRVPGVGQVIVFGERRYSMRLWLDPNKLANRGLTAGDVVKALQEQNVQVAAGSVGDAPAVPGQTYQISVRAEGRLADASQFNDIIVKSGGAASLVRLSDVGRAELGAESYASSLRFQGIDAVGFAVVQLPTANALEVDRLVRAELLRLSASFPPGLKAQIAFNTTQVVDESIKEVRKTLIEAIALVVLVMFLFLQSWRSTVIPTITIPVVARRRLRVREGDGLLDQHAHALRNHPGDRHRRRRCDRRDREHRAAHSGRSEACEAGGVRRDAGSDRRRHRDGPRADRGLRAGRVLPGHDRPPLLAVLDHDCLFGRALGVQCGDVDTGAVRPAPRSRAPREGDVLLRRRARDRCRYHSVRRRAAAYDALQVGCGAPVLRGARSDGVALSDRAACIRAGRGRRILHHSRPGACGIIAGTHGHDRATGGAGSA